MHKKISMIDDISSEELLDECIKHIRKKEHREKIHNIKETLLTAIEDYRRNASTGDLSAITPITLADEIKEILKNLYINQMGRSSNKNLPRQVYKKILEGLGFLCPYCEDGHVYTIDHFLPKSIFAEFSVTIENLVPACRDCNSAKKEYISKTKDSQLLHPYFDEEIHERWLKAELLYNDSISFNYIVIDTDRIDPILLQRINFQFDLLDLNRKYSENAISKFYEWLNCSRQNIRNRENLFDLCQELNRQNRENTWEKCLWEALIDNIDQLCSYLKRKRLIESL